MYSSFVNMRLVKGKADFFDPIKNVNFDVGPNKKKNIQKVVSVMNR